MLASGSLHVLLCLLSALLSGGVGVYALRRRVPGALPFGMAALSQSFWTLGHLAEFLTDSLEGKLLWDNLQFFGTAGWAIAFFSFAAEYTNRRAARSRWVWLGHAVLAVPYLGMVVFAPLHPWLRPWAVLARRGNHWVLDYPFTPATWGLFVYLLVLFGASVGFLAEQALRAPRKSQYRLQNVIVILGVLMPLGGITLTMLGISFGAERDMSPITFGISNAVVAWGLFRHRLLDLVPIARDLVIENLRAGVIVLDSEGRVVDLNPSARERLSRTNDVMVGQLASEVLGPWAEMAQGAPDGPSSRRRVISDPVQKRHHELTVVPLRDRWGGVQGRVIVAYDVTALKEAEQELVRQNVRLENINKELDAFSFSVSHDLRAPLRAVEGFATLLRQECAVALGEEGRRYLGFIDDGVRRMQGLISSLLELARVSRRTLQRKPVEVSGLVHEVVQDLAPELEGREVDIVVMDLPPCSADPTLLRQVVANLLGNAVKFTRDRTPARIEVGWLEGNELTYFVKDNGVGFDMKYADRLFGVFQRLHDVSEFEGNGVGLATANRIVSRHGGRIWAEGVLDRGTTVYFTLGS